MHRLECKLKPFQFSCKKCQVSFSAVRIRESWRPSVTGNQGYLLQTCTDGCKDSEDTARGFAYAGIWLNQGLLTCPSSAGCTSFLGHHLLGFDSVKARSFCLSSLLSIQVGLMVLTKAAAELDVYSPTVVPHVLPIYSPT